MHAKRQIQTIIKILFGISQVIIFLIGVFITIFSITIFIREKQILGIKWIMFLYALILGKICIFIGSCGTLLLSHHRKLLVCIYTSLVVTLINFGFIFLLITPRIIERFPEWSNKQWGLIKNEQRNFIQLQLECCGFYSKEDRAGSVCITEEACRSLLLDLFKLIISYCLNFSFFIVFLSSINLIILSMLKMK